MNRSLQIGRVAGIAIGVHYTWLFAFALITWSLASGFFPEEFPGWERTTYWLIGVVAALILFVSVLVHELAHSLVAKSKGVPVQGITLFIFGGVSTISQETRRPADEFVIAVVGPLASFILSGVFWLVHRAIGAPMTPVGAVLIGLSYINLTLGIFNLLPGYPLDGGRVLRSILWGSTRSLPRATNIAATVGQVFGWLFIGYGVFQVLNGNLLSGLWIALIGWFLNNAADSSKTDSRTQNQLQGVKVSQVMRRTTDNIPPDMTIETLVWEHILKEGRRAIPVVDSEGRGVGIVSISDVKKSPREQWATTLVSQVMTREPLQIVTKDDTLETVLALLTKHDVNQALVLEDGMLRGVVSRGDIMRYLELSQLQGRGQPARTV